MDRRRKTERQPARRAAPDSPDLSDRAAAVYLAALLVAAVVCFFPLLTYFFAQDDFTLMLKAWRDGWGAVGEYFQAKPGMFRPLTKVIYFGAMHGLFGLNPLPFHLVSMSVHLANVVLLYALLRRVGRSRTTGLVATTLFALSVAFFHVIAWISCVQQLLGLMFMLAALIWGIDYGDGDSREVRWWSLGAYILALLSVEQAFAVPLILVAYLLLTPCTRGGTPGARIGLRGAVRLYSTHLAVLGLYALFMIIWKTPPSTGSYAISLDWNVAVNLLTYLGWSLQFGAELPSWMQSENVTWSVSYPILALLIAYLAFNRRWREIAFGVTVFGLAVVPVLPLSGHTFYLHTYIPSVGVWYLISVAVDDLRNFRRIRARAAQVAVLGVVLAAATAVSFVMVRRNERLPAIEGVEGMPRSFVLRRATIARNFSNSLAAHEPFDPSVTRVYLVYARETGQEAALWNNDNVKAATGWGSLVPLVYGNPNLEAVFKLSGDAVGRDQLDRSDIYFYDDFGTCFAVEPVELE